MLMCVTTRSLKFARIKLHALSTNTTHRLHIFYAHVGAAIPLTGTVLPEVLLLQRTVITSLLVNVLD